MFSRFLQLQDHPRIVFGYMSSCLKHAFRIITKVIFLSLSGLQFGGWHTNDYSRQRAENNTHYTAFFCLCDSCLYKNGSSTLSFKLALCIVLTDPQLCVCLSAFLNKYTTIRPIQRPLTRSCLHILHSNKQNRNQQEGYDHLMSSQKFLSLASYSQPEHHGNCQPVAWQNTSEYIGVSCILKTSQTFSHCLEHPEKESANVFQKPSHRLAVSPLIRPSYTLVCAPANSFTPVQSPVDMKSTAEQVIA